METKAGRSSKRYGVEFYIAQTTMGSGTYASYNGKYLLTTNNNRSLGGVYTTWAFWIRIKSGGSIYIQKSDRLYRDLVEVTTTHTEITPADGWVHIVAVKTSKEGYSHAMPYIYANNGDVVQIALPVVAPGGIGIGWHTAPIPTVSAVSRSEYTDANVLAKIKNVDGAGSGLDADTVRGYVPVNKSGDKMTGPLVIAPAGTAAIEIGRVDGVASNPFIDFHSGAIAVDYDSRIVASGGNGVAGGGTLNLIAANVITNGYKIWHAGNDGAGSGLDADKIDTYHAVDITNGITSGKTTDSVYFQMMGV
jgi:hypothetical protein